jgi:hypothetical protein
LQVALDWHSAALKHRTDLRNFRCADPDDADFDDERGWIAHDAPWEFLVQEHVNALNPPFTLPSVLLVGYDSVGLAAILSLVIFPLDRHVFVAAVAVAHRVSGNGLAGEALDRIGPAIKTLYKIESDYYLTARIDPSNYAAKSVFAGRGFEHETYHGRFEKWAKKVD